MRKELHCIICSLFVIILLIFTNGCTKIRITEKTVGCTFDQNNIISNSCLTFTYNKYDGKRDYKDLFNFIYFEGDTVCFSFTFNEYIKSNYPEIFFVNPTDGKKFKAERIDIDGKTSYGFSLVGTIMEQFLHKKLNDTIPKNTDSIEIPFQLYLKMNTPDALITSETTHNLKINFGDTNAQKN